MVADLIQVYGGVAVEVGTFYGYQSPMRVGVFVLGASEQCDSDVNMRMRLNKGRTLRVHINWMEGARVCEGELEEGGGWGGSDARETHGTGGHNRRVGGSDA